MATDAPVPEGARLHEWSLDMTNTVTALWDDIGYRSAANEFLMETNGFVICAHLKKPRLHRRWRPQLVLSTILKPKATHLSADGADVPLSPGMAVTIEIKTGSRRILEYLLSPLVEVGSEALRER